MKVSAEPAAIELRRPAGLTILVVLFLLVVLPGRIRLSPPWVLFIAGAAVLAPMIAVGGSTRKTLWLRIYSKQEIPWGESREGDFNLNLVSASYRRRE